MSVALAHQRCAGGAEDDDAEDGEFEPEELSLQEVYCVLAALAETASEEGGIFALTDVQNGGDLARFEAAEVKRAYHWRPSAMPALMESQCALSVHVICATPIASQLQLPTPSEVRACCGCLCKKR